LVSGKGIERLKNKGIEILVGCLENECRTLNKHFFTFHEKKRPYIMLKWAQTPKGKIDQGLADGKVTWISAPETQTKVHAWRKNHQAILVGRNTIEQDNPTLTVRAVTGNNPIRIVLDSELKLPATMNCFNAEAPTIVLNKLKSEVVGTVEYIQLERMTAQSILDALFERNIQSVLVEGGSATLQSFIDVDLWDEAKVITGQVVFEQGTVAPVLNSTVVDEEQFFGDTIQTYRNR
jgi:diaminohydroxyphosphoribosylaminopyrimidine deaminase/5-amino-6-(5-phosphoribosylamino)uracil reductase